MTGVCPADEVLDRLLADLLSATEEAALEGHVAGCAACQQRLEQLTRGDRTLPARPANAEQRRETTPSPSDVLAWSSIFVRNPGLQRSESNSLRTTAFEPNLEVRQAAPESASTPPTVFGRYEVRRELGAGGFGTVFLGHDTQLDRSVAIKVLHGGPAVAQAKRDHFLQEARRLARLRHPGIVTVHDVGIQDGWVYVVSDFLDGRSLDVWLAGRRPSWREAVRITAAVADALAHAHLSRTVHRDVKPANIIVLADGTPVLVDFGLGLDEAVAGGRELGLISGTPMYMSPEQVSGTAHRIDGRTDVYSLGAVLYEMLCGRVPFQADDSRELLRQVRDDEPQPPRQLVGDLPPELERICIKALAKSMQDRYTTAADFAEDLRRVAQATPDPASRHTSQQFPGELPAARLSPVPTALQSRARTPTSQRRVREAERRQVTVLVCGSDLFDREEFLERVEAEDQATLLKTFQQTCERSVARFDGTVVQCNERGLLVCFGYPVAYEDAARRAALTALSILEELNAVSNQLRSAHGLELRPWIGLHTGQAIVEMGETAVSLVGDARNVAIRLEDVAEPGQIVCSEATHRLIHGHFQCASHGRRKLKGVQQPIEFFLVQGVGEARSADEAAVPSGLTPLTGRDLEVSLLKDRWEQAQEGMGQVVLIVGEPGLGKSRLVYTIKQHVRAQADGQDSTVIEWRCSPHYQNSGLYPAANYLERTLGFGRDEPPAARLDRLVRHLQEYDLARPDVIPLFAALLSLPPTDRFPSLGLSPVREREETLRALGDWLRASAGRRPVLFVVEDLHWVDASTLEFLGQFLAEGLQDRVLTVLTFRPEFQTPWPALAHQTSLALNRLTRRQAGELMRKKTGSPDLPDAFVDQVYDRTGGVPLFVEEFTKMVPESGVPEALIARQIPATLQDLVMARLDRLEGDRDVAQLAATLGREFSYELIAAVAPTNEPTLQAELAKLVQAEILFQKGRLPQCNFIFKHALIEDAAYNSMVKDKRQQFHRRIAEVLEARFPQTVETQPEVLARHFTEAGMADKGVGYWLKAGLRSRERSADVEAIGHLTKGRALLESLPESPERDARELELLNPLGTAYIAARGYAAPEVGPAFRRARELCERVGEPLQQFAIMRGTFAWHVVRGEFRLCMDLAAEALDFASRLNDPGVMMEALFLKVVALMYRGDFAGTRDHCVRALAEYDDRERTRFWSGITGEDSGVTHRCYLALALWHLGYPDHAFQVNHEAIELARAIGHPFSLEYALHHTGWLNQHCRLGPETQSAGDETIRIAREQGFSFWQATGTLYSSAGLLLQARLNDALPALLKGLAAYRATGAELALPFYLSILGDAYTQAGQFEDAHQALDEGLALAEKNDDRFQEAELHRFKGELLLAESADAGTGAEDHFLRAIETARRQQSKAWELRATMSLARYWQQQGRRDEARATLAAVHGTFTEGFTTPDLVEAGELLKA